MVTSIRKQTLRATKTTRRDKEKITWRTEHQMTDSTGAMDRPLTMASANGLSPMRMSAT
jgi:hypothetical protein